MGLTEGYPAVALAFEEIHTPYVRSLKCQSSPRPSTQAPGVRLTPYASGRDICVQKFGMRIKEIEKRMAHFESTFTVPPSNDLAKYWNVVRKRCALSSRNTRVPSLIVCLICSSRRVETESRLLHTLYAPLPWFCVQLDFDIRRNLR